MGNVSLVAMPQYISKVGRQRRKAGRLIDVIILPPQQSHPTAGCSLYREETTEDHGIVPNGGEKGAVKYRSGGSGHNHRIGSARGVERTDAAPDATDDAPVEEGEYSIGGHGAQCFVRCEVGNAWRERVTVWAGGHVGAIGVLSGTPASYVRGQARYHINSGAGLLSWLPITLILQLLE